MCVCLHQATSVSTRSVQEGSQTVAPSSLNPPACHSSPPAPLNFSAPATPSSTGTTWDWWCCCSLMTQRPVQIPPPSSVSPTLTSSTTLAAATSNWHSWPSYWLNSAACPASRTGQPAQSCCAGTLTRRPGAHCTAS